MCGNEDSNVVTIIDIASRKVAGQVDVGVEPKAWRSTRTIAGR